ncbi:hypothetical protein E4U41_001617 [Claviceps citrina]|nr:hypothetical protein E4U41_001617 [Claviceps citrina]
MSRSLANRLGALPLNPSRSKASVSISSFQAWRCFSQSPKPHSDGPKGDSRSTARPKTESFLARVLNDSPADRAEQSSKAMNNLSTSMIFQALGQGSSKLDTSVLTPDGSREPPKRREDELEPYHFHVYSHKHNTHITCTKPNREPIISMSCGNIGFRKSRRGTFDSAYSLTKYVLERLIHTDKLSKMTRLELVLRGFGQGREAVVKLLMSPEGKVLRDRIVRVADSTRIKFAGTRSEKPRRL